MASSAPPTAALLEAMAHAGARRYGAERVSELAHALQCAELAEASGADEELTLACLLHDVGRVAVDQALVFDRVGGAQPGTRGHQAETTDEQVQQPGLSARAGQLAAAAPRPTRRGSSSRLGRRR